MAQVGTAEASSSSTSSRDYVDQAHTDAYRIDYVIPSSFFILPPVGASLGMVIGLVRGGRRARLRFLAENAHRRPDTYQGWYFYTKTRNYKVMYEAAKLGTKYAFALGGATLSFVFLEEYAAWAREEWFGDSTEAKPVIDGLRERTTWRQGRSRWMDGAIAGSILGTAVGTGWLYLRAVGLGTVLGGIHSTLLATKDQFGKALAEQQKEKQRAEAEGGSTTLPTPVKPAESTSAQLPIVDRPPLPSLSIPVASDPPVSEDKETSQAPSLWSRAKRWVSSQ